MKKIDSNDSTVEGREEQVPGRGSFHEQEMLSTNRTRRRAVRRKRILQIGVQSPSKVLWQDTARL